MLTEYSIYTPTYCNCRQNIQNTFLHILDFITCMSDTRLPHAA